LRASHSEVDGQHGSDGAYGQVRNKFVGACIAYKSTDDRSDTHAFAVVHSCRCGYLQEDGNREPRATHDENPNILSGQTCDFAAAVTGMRSP
jgi:hypothetical protein